MSYSTADIGKLIQETRKRLGVTQKELALTAGTGLRSIVELEKAKETWEIGKVLTLLHTLGIKMALTSRAAKQEGSGDGPRTWCLPAQRSGRASTLRIAN